MPPLPRPHIPGGPVRWAAVVLACAAVGAVAGPTVSQAQQPDRAEEAGQPDQRAAELQLPAEGDPTEGARLYTQRCARCHGPGGRGGELAPSLVGLDVARVDLVLRTNRMPPASPTGEGTGPVDWTTEERADLLAYAADTFDLTGSLPQVEPGDATVGRNVFADFCAACHGFSGGGGVAGAGTFVPPVAGQTPATIAEAVRIGPFEMPQFGPRQVSDEEIGDVAAYLAAVPEEKKTPVLGLMEVPPVHAAAFVALLAAIMLVSCAWLGGRVLMFPDPVSTRKRRRRRNRSAAGESGEDTADEQEGNQT